MVIMAYIWLGLVFLFIIINNILTAICPYCRGTGNHIGYSYGKCGMCGGDGNYWSMRKNVKK